MGMLYIRIYVCMYTCVRVWSPHGAVDPKENERLERAHLYRGCIRFHLHPKVDPNEESEWDPLLDGDEILYSGPFQSPLTRDPLPQVGPQHPLYLIIYG